jgi:hypothetical protein
MKKKILGKLIVDTQKVMQRNQIEKKNVCRKWQKRFRPFIN